MRVFVTGATGFIGSAVSRRLARDGHAVTAWVRSRARAREVLGGAVELRSARDGPETLRAALKDAEAVVNLAGEPVVGRWTAARRKRLVDSRVGVTVGLVDAMAAATRRPQVLVSGSAVGYYGARDEVVDEDSPPGDGFLAELCRQWEAAALRARALGVRVVTLRTGVVLGAGGGALAAMLPPFRLGLGGPIGSGRQYVSWIHLADLVEVIVTALGDARYAGAVNGVAPEPVTNRELAQAIGRALHRPAFLRVPAPAVRLALGRAASFLLEGQRVDPRRLRELGFTHRYPTIAAALDDILAAAPAGRLVRARGTP